MAIQVDTLSLSETPSVENSSQDSGDESFIEETPPSSPAPSPPDPKVDYFICKNCRVKRNRPIPKRVCKKLKFTERVPWKNRDGSARYIPDTAEIEFWFDLDSYTRMKHLVSAAEGWKDIHSDFQACMQDNEVKVDDSCDRCGYNPK